MERKQNILLWVVLFFLLSCLLVSGAFSEPKQQSCQCTMSKDEFEYRLRTYIDDIDQLVTELEEQIKELSRIMPKKDTGGNV